MKKILSTVLSGVVVAVMCVFMCVCMAACSSIKGTYKLKALIITDSDGTTKTYAVGEEYNYLTLSADSVVCEVKSDNNFTLKASLNSELSVEGSWEKKNGKYYFTVVDTMEATLKGKELTLIESEQRTFVLEK